ncbi:MAG: hypothetical protein N3B10_13775 [Armatimonadetes bacterium]|nr:hypothetical protein [Armatimonadota bacterium]MCX7969538.1 hypothetical protein [Armatimonadota bacterium]MDW8142571.1 hypothetical protein [Armatimonadota bacterium]
MNRLVSLLNRLRSEARWEWLSESQKSVSKQLLDFLRVNDTVNLYGTHGVGKTFLAWVWLREWQRFGFGRIAYFPFASLITPNERCRFAIVDNLPSYREGIRDAIRQCRICGYERILLITVHAAADQLPKVRLDLTEADIEQISERLRRLGFPPYSDQPKNLWELVVPILP